LLLAGCGLVPGGGEGSTEVRVIAGGGADPEAAEASALRVDGVVLDLAAADDVVHLLAQREHDGGGVENYLLRIDEDGFAMERDVGDTSRDADEELRYLAAGGDDVYVASRQAIYQVGDAGTDQLFEVPDGPDEAM